MSARYIISLVFALALLAPASSQARAPAYDDGMRAYDAADYRQAAVIWNALAEVGHAQAQFNLGFMYEFGYGVKPSATRSFKWYRRAAEQGHIEAQHAVGWMYDLGKGVKRDRVEALKWLSRATSNPNNEGFAPRDPAPYRQEDLYGFAFKQAFFARLQAELKQAVIRYETQKSISPPAPIDMEASNQTS